MGINAELVRLVADLRSRNVFGGDSVIEIGAQNVCVAPEVVSKILDHYHIKVSQLETSSASDLYLHFGFNRYTCIDATGGRGALVFDLNKDVREDYQFVETFDLVTNLGTAEHCFNQFSVFKNLHDLCKPDGVMIHALPAQGNVNHGFYNYHPRFFADLAAANRYEIIDLSFTVDYKPALIKYSKEEFQKWDSHDLLFYAVLRKNNNSPFSLPFDGMFASASRLPGYTATNVDPLVTEFSPYLKGGNWENTRGITGEDPARW
jgi:SAM-dependent methyltransferase